MDHDRKALDTWAVVELTGSELTIGCRIRETSIAGTGMLRLDIPATTGNDGWTEYIAPGAVYAIHPTTRDVAATAAAGASRAPVLRQPYGSLMDPLRRDLLRLLDRVEHVTCDHDPNGTPDPACAGCVVRTLATVAGRHGVDDDTDHYSLDAAQDEGYEPDPDPDYGKDLDDEDDEDPRAWQG